MKVLSTRALNRALLARQMLLRRAMLPVTDVLEHLVGMQSQVPNAPYVGLWSRLAHFRPDQLSRLILNRQAVRLALMRNTLHLVTAEDCLALRPVVHRLLVRAHNKTEPRTLAKIVAAGRALVEERPRTNIELGRLLQRKFPNQDPIGLGYVIRDNVALVQVPPRGVWGQSSAATLTTAEAWLGRPLATSIDPSDMLNRYLLAFGPASLSDMTAWSGLPGLKETAERLRPELRVFRDERGRELFDVPDGLLPRASLPAPVRFLPEFDNVLVAYADRARIIPEEYRSRVTTQLGRCVFLVDGFVRGFWRIERKHDSATLHLEPFDATAARSRSAIEREGLGLLAFVAGDARRRQVRWSRAPKSR